MSRQILQAIGRITAGFGVAGASVFAVLPMDGCEEALEIALEQAPGLGSDFVFNPTNGFGPGLVDGGSGPDYLTTTKLIP